MMRFLPGDSHSGRGEVDVVRHGEDCVCRGRHGDRGGKTELTIEVPSSGQLRVEVRVTQQKD
ncbi:hypothetical protein KIN20_027265 [Parelaphostrongylus tenuis]|uniref:Uncharacterized protein n=1 Tax=Parelaphostrongylus tenuis TaxID=148309 RepID=A0AAD5WDN4_PARTN|nr:hypothetical protein KIN20_027265 [Parelaphostrongylus tenuis]